MRRELKVIGLKKCVSTRKPGCDKLFGRVVYYYDTVEKNVFMFSIDFINLVTLILHAQASVIDIKKN